MHKKLMFLSGCSVLVILSQFFKPVAGCGHTNTLLYGEPARAALSTFATKPEFKTELVTGRSLLPFMSVMLSEDSAYPVNHPVYSPKDLNIEALKRSVEPLMRMTIKDVVAQVPTESGIFFIGCPNCHGGVEEARVLGWKPGMGLKVRCNYCGMVFPNKQFPNNREKVIIAPSGTRQVYRYYEDSTGHQYYFEAHASYERWYWIRSLAEKLAQLWYVTRDNAYGDRAAAIAGRFAQVFPDYAVRFDYPNVPVQFFPADQKWPYEGLTPYRGAKWNWWAYVDIPSDLANVYDILMSGYDWKRMNVIIGRDTNEWIARDLLRLSYEFTTANPDDYSNMSPYVYTDMVRVGRILGSPGMVHKALKHLRDFFLKGFFADGWWREGSPSYHDQTINSLARVADALSGYVDPVDWMGERFDNPDMIKQNSLFGKALQVSREVVFPNGRKIPINDTWSFDRGEKTDSAISRLWPALGNAAVGAGRGKDQIMLNVNWSGDYGHSHYDNGAIILYAAEQELLSDIGYTNSKYRGWATYTASHNTVVIDHKNQDAGSEKKPVTGRLQFYDDKDPRVKVVDVDASPAYSMSDMYRRKLVMVHADEGHDYVVDRFDVKGGQVHDWFLHGMCEQEGVLETSVLLNRSVKTLVPEWGGNNLPKTEYDMELSGKRFHSYVFLQDINAGAAMDLWTATWRYDSSGLRSHIFSQPYTEAFRFRSSSVRPANEDDNKLDNYMRNGIMQRHSGGSSTFLAVHEPFSNNPWIASVKMEGEVMIVCYKLKGAAIEDRITLNNGDEITVSSSAGWKYQSGTPVSGEVKSLDKKGGNWSLELDKQVPEVNYIRLDFSGGQTYYCPVAATHGNRLELKDDPGFTLDKDGKVRFYTFPHYQYDAPLRYTLFVKKLNNN